MNTQRRMLGLAGRLLLLALFVLPFMMATVAAVRPAGEIYRYGIDLSLQTFVPREITLDNFRAALARPHFIRQLANTFLVGVVQPSAAVLLGFFAAFALSRMDFRGRDAMLFIVVATLFIPFEAVVVPTFILVRDLGLQGNYAGLILPWIANPLAVFLLRQAMMEIPRELDEAVLVDGGGLLSVLLHAILPHVWPALITVWLFVFVGVWDSYLWPLVVLNSPESQMVQIGMKGMFGELDGVAYGTVFASALLAIGPVLIVFLFLQRFYVQGIATTGLK